MGYIYGLTSPNLYNHVSDGVLHLWIKIGRTEYKESDLVDDYNRYLPDRKIIFYTCVGKSYGNIEHMLLNRLKGQIHEDLVRGEWFFCGMDTINRVWVEVIYPNMKGKARCSVVPCGKMRNFQSRGKGRLMCHNNGNYFSDGLPVCGNHR